MFENFEIVRLTNETFIDRFDCGNEELNDFLINKAKDYANHLLSVTYLVENKQDIIAYFSLLNDKMSLADSDRATWRKIKKIFPYSKHRLDYPALKIGRLAVSLDYQCTRAGSIILNTIKQSLVSNNRTGCAFVTVDALKTAVPFYQKNGFLPLDKQQFQQDVDTSLLYYDLSQLV